MITNVFSDSVSKFSIVLIDDVLSDDDKRLLKLLNINFENVLLDLIADVQNIIEMNKSYIKLDY